MINNNVWSEEEEIALLSAILECGYGNWREVSSRLQERSPKECELRYLRRFVLEPEAELSAATESFRRVRESGALCSDNCRVQLPASRRNSRYGLSHVVEREELLKSAECPGECVPPHFDGAKPVQKSRSLYCGSVVCPGYSGERSEFSVEYDDRAESLLASMCVPEWEEVAFGDAEDKSLCQKLQLALIDGYNFRLSERERRKKVIRNHALIDRRKTYSMFQRYENYCGKQNLTALLKFIQFMKTGPELDLLLERMKYQTELRIQLNTMINYRGLGMRLLDSVLTYEKLNKKRLKYRRELAINFIPLSIDSLGIRTSRRSSAPLSLHNLPGYTLLDDEEKDLCSVARIVPETYYSFKKLLIQECKKNNGLKLAQARHLIKIDVNKTRKMYDHLLSKGLIWLPT